jgi:uncharacterized membrane protein
MYHRRDQRTLMAYAGRSKVVVLMTRTIRAEAVFVSDLQPSDCPTPGQVTAAVLASLHAFGGATGCAATAAAEYGEHPETAVARMRWALNLVDGTAYAAVVPAAAA